MWLINVKLLQITRVIIDLFGAMLNKCLHFTTVWQNLRALVIVLFSEAHGISQSTNGSIMSQLWPIGDNVPQLTHKLRPGFSITRLVAV